MNIRQLETALVVPYRTAQKYVERLEEIGVLREVTGHARREPHAIAERGNNFPVPVPRRHPDASGLATSTSKSAQIKANTVRLILTKVIYR
jgi:hypothetical protein